ncbi:sulfatase-like hydrolase/transferase [Novosphingobium sediminicola]|uniref:Choline-sulfatase n=1 Tax=Novosphingobium sediminicola TaxID=563162 RepID=A0A7W6G6U5_9SPHN|nr:sulfatase-like hydrolase/transferase [Novosphingobium sediminicola]MBB3956124.1 choline-sulfatase [Novosphingobium sediminicola]
MSDQTRKSMNLGRRDVLGGVAGGIASAMFGPAMAAPKEGAGRPNMILFFMDECRADALGSYGNPLCKTPNLDAFARQGTRFADCHVQHPVCGASRCSLLTGLPVSNTGHRSLYYFLRRDEPNLFRYLKDGGYDTFWLGKNDALAPESFPLSLTEWHGEVNTWARAGGRGPAFDLGKPNLMLINAKVDPKATSDYLLIQQAIKLLERGERDKPFCLFIALNQPHPPYLAPQGFHDLYKPEALPPLAPPGLGKKPMFHDAVRKAYHLDQAGDADFRQVRATYYGQVSYADWLFGQLMEAVERTGRAKDTMVIASSDHGDYAGDYGMVEKWPGGLESNLTHVPLMIRMPGGAQGHVVSEMVELYDVMATMLEAGRVQAKHTHFAQSLMPQIMGSAGDPTRAAYTEAGYDTFEPQAFEPPMEGPANLYTAKHDLQNEQPATVRRAAAVTTSAYKFVARPGGQYELYDRKRDPLELRNLIDDPKMKQVREAMADNLMAHYISTTGVPPIARDGRDTPEFYIMPKLKKDGIANSR